MSRHSILFFNNFSKFHGNGHDGGSHHTDSQDLNDLSSSSETSISQSLEHDLFHMERSAQAHTHDSLGKSQASPQVLKFMNYMKDLENSPTADPFNNHIILTSHATQGNRGTLHRVHSLENFEKIGNRNNKGKKLNESLFSTSDRPSKSPQKSLFERRRNKQVPLTSQFRRKSCHCSDCGGISKFELKVPDVVQAYNKQIRMAQLIRGKLKEKSPKANSSPHLQLPDLQKMLIEGSKSGKNRPQKKGMKHKSHNILKIETGSVSSVHFGAKDFHQAGSETPLKQNKRSSIEGKVLSISNGLYHIRIITAPEVEDAEEEHSEEMTRERKESPKKEHGLLRPLGLALKKKKAAKKNKAKVIQNLPLPQTPRSALRQSIVVDDVVLLNRSPNKEPTMMISAVTPQESARKKAGFVIKRSSSKVSNVTADSPRSKVSYGKLSNGDVNTPTLIQKEMWRPVSMCSPKFKSTFAPKIEEELEYAALNHENTSLHKNSASVKLSPKILKKVYSSSPKTIPKLKIAQRSEFPSIKPVSSARVATTKSNLTVTEPNEIGADEPRKLYYFNLSSLTERKNPPTKDDSKSKDHSLSMKQSYDFTQSPYAFSLSAQRRLKVNSVNIDSASSRPKTSSLEKILEKSNKLSLKKVMSEKPPSIKSSLVAIHSPKESQIVMNNGKINKESPVSSISSPREFKLAGITHNTPSRRFMFA